MSIKKRYKSTEFCEIIGISMRTLDRRIAKGEVTPIVENGFRYFNDEHVSIYTKEVITRERISIAYCRVSTNNQKKELQSQIDSLETFSVNSGIILDEYLCDIGSGINFKRKNFIKLIDLVISGKIDKIYISYKDRLCRFAFDLVEHLFNKFGTEIIVINLQSTSPQEELVEDLMTIIHVFSSRLYGLRRYKKVLKDADLLS